MSTRLTVIGSLNYDLVTFTSRVPDGGETISAHSFETHTGGKGFNEALALARLTPAGPKIRMIGKVGDDHFGTELLDTLKSENVDISKVEIIKDTRTGVATILVEDNGENRILITGGANDLLKPNDEELANYFPKNDNFKEFVMLQNEFPFFAQVITWLKKSRPNIQNCYNPSPIKDIPSDYLKGIDLLIVNEIESVQIFKTLGLKTITFPEDSDVDTKITLAKKIATVLAKKINQGGLNLVIVTLGSAGAVYAQGIKSEFIQSYKVSKEKVIDTTGAGDTFFGSVVSQLSLGSSAKEALEFAVVASAFAIQKKGAGDSIPTYEVVSNAFT